MNRNKILILSAFLVCTMICSGCSDSSAGTEPSSESGSAAASSESESGVSEISTPPATQSDDESEAVSSTVKPNPGREAQHLIVDGEIFRDAYAWSSLLLVSGDNGYEVVQSNNPNAAELAENALKQNNRLGATTPVDGQPQNELEISDTVYSEEVYRVDENLLILVAQIKDFSAEGLPDDVVQRIADKTVYYGRYFTAISDTEGFESAYPDIAETALN